MVTRVATVAFEGTVEAIFRARPPMLRDTETRLEADA